MKKIWKSGVPFAPKFQKGFSLIEAIIVLVIIGLLVSIVGGALRTSDGERTGTIQKFSYAGSLFRTYEGELATEGIKIRTGKNGGSGGNTFEFSVEANNKQVIEQIQQAQRAQQVVTLQYHQNRLYVPWNGGTRYFISNVIVSNPNPTQTATPVTGSVLPQ